MANAVVQITQQFTKPYLTLTEYKNAPTALDYGNIVAGGTQAAQDAELTNAIYRASSYIDQYCSQILGATTNQERQRVRFSNDGTLKIHPQYHPIVALTALSFGPTPNNLTAVPDCSVAWIEDQQIIFPASGASLSYSTSGPLGFGFGGPAGSEVYTQYTYVNGYVNSLLASSPSIGATSITVDDASGIIPGQGLRIYDGASTENVIVATNYVFGSTTVPLAAPLTYAHNSGVCISGLPAAIKEACILVTSAYLKIRGDAALVLEVTNQPAAQLEGSQKVGSDISQAQDLLKPFRRMR
jgi:hypothetical protein